MLIEFRKTCLATRPEDCFNGGLVLMQVADERLSRLKTHWADWYHSEHMSIHAICLECASLSVAHKFRKHNCPSLSLTVSLITQMRGIAKV